ncbi:MAG: ROK family glucokinase [Nocardioidaceae bacterium]
MATRASEPRPALRVARNLLTTATIGVDIGGTKVLAGVVDTSGQVLDQVRLETPDRSTSPLVVEDTIVAAVEELLASHPAAAVGIGAAGFVDARRATVLFSPHLSWRNEPLRQALFARLRMPVIVDNDANTAAWAEYRFGAGARFSQILCITLGTGIGGALVIDGRVFRGANGMAGEFGHMQVVPGGHRCECGNRGCWEQYASGNSLVREARELIVSGSPVAEQLRTMAGADASRLSGPLVSQAARQGDPTAVELIADVGRWLGVGMASLSAAFDPDCIIVGGGVSEAGELLIAPAREALARTLTGRGFRPMPPVVPATLGASAGMVGAADMARSAVRRSRHSPRKRERRNRRRMERLEARGERLGY